MGEERPAERLVFFHLSAVDEFDAVGGVDDDLLEQEVEDAVELDGVAARNEGWDVGGLVAKGGAQVSDDALTLEGGGLGFGVFVFGGADLLVEGGEAALEYVYAEEAAQVAIFETGTLGFEVVEPGAVFDVGLFFGRCGGLPFLKIRLERTGEESADALDKFLVVNAEVLGPVDRAAPDQSVGVEAGAVLLPPHGGVAFAAVKQPCKLVIFASLETAGTAFEFGVYFAQYGFIP